MLSNYNSWRKKKAMSSCKTGCHKARGATSRTKKKRGPHLGPSDDGCRFALGMVRTMRHTFEASSAAGWSIVSLASALGISFCRTRLAHGMVWTGRTAFGTRRAAFLPLPAFATTSIEQIVGARRDLVLITSFVVVAMRCAFEAGSAASGTIVAWPSSALPVGFRAHGALGVLCRDIGAAPSIWAACLTIVSETTTLCVGARRWALGNIIVGIIVGLNVGIFVGIIVGIIVGTRWNCNIATDWSSIGLHNRTIAIGHNSLCCSIVQSCAILLSKDLGVSNKL